MKFKNVSFHYEDLPVLDDVSFSVEPGQTVALLGSTGSGKTTLTSLISRFYDATAGEIYIDNHPITDYDIQTLRSNISIAMQDIFLFSDTIEALLPIGVPKARKKTFVWHQRLQVLMNLFISLKKTLIRLLENAVLGFQEVSVSGSP